MSELWNAVLQRHYCYTCKQKHSWHFRTIVCIDIPWPGSPEAKELGYE